MPIKSTKIFYLFLILTTHLSTGQTSQLFEGIDFTDSMRLAVMHPHFDKNNAYESYDLIIVQKQVLDSVAALCVYYEEVTNFYDRAEPSIILLEGNKSIKRWAINPKKASIRINGKSYRFNTDMIQSLASKYPLKYTTNKREFKSPEEFEEFRSEVYKDQSLLFMYKPNFKYEGSFEVRFTKSNKFKHPKDISPFLKSQLTKLTSKDNFRIYYKADKYNMTHPNQFTMTVDSDKDLYNIFKAKKSEKLSWEDAIYSATIFKSNTYNKR